MEVRYRGGLRQLLGVRRAVRTEILLAIAARPPLTVLIKKAVFRYYRPLLEGDQQRLVAEVATWVQQLDAAAVRSRMSLLRGLHIAEAFSGP